MPQRTAKQIHEKILEKDNFLLITHQNPDADAIGSVSALGQFLASINKKYTIFCVTPVSQQFHFLRHARDVVNHESVWKKEYGVVIICDSGDLRYAGVDEYIKILPSKPTLINIDHHASNENFGDYNLVIEAASSTTEIIYNFFKYNEVEITNTMATALLSGLITDTNNFSNAGTSRQALSVASSLVKRGAQLNLIRKNLVNNRPTSIFKLWGRVLSRLDYHNETDIVYTYITQKDLQECGANEEETEGIANLLNHLDEGKASMVIREKPDGSMKTSLRTTKEDVDVSKLAQYFEGGGHKKAAGFSLKGPTDVALKNIWFTLEKFAKDNYTGVKDQRFKTED